MKRSTEPSVNMARTLSLAAVIVASIRCGCDCHAAFMPAAALASWCRSLVLRSFGGDLDESGRDQQQLHCCGANR